MSIDPSVDLNVIPRTDAGARKIVNLLTGRGSIGVKTMMVEVDDPALDDLAIYSVLLSRDPIHQPGNPPDVRWHLSVAGQYDVPPWSHLVAIGHRLRPGVPMVVGVPPRSWWMSVHPHCLHLWESKDHTLLEQWQAEANGAVPS